MKIGDCVGRGIFVFVLFFFGSFGAKAQLWVEDFAAEGNGAQSGTAGGTLGGSWFVDVDPGGTFAVQSDAFRINNTGSEGTWTSDLINISSVGYAIIDIEVLTFGIGFSASDYLAFYYRLDGGPEVQFAYADAAFWSAETSNKVSAIVAANTLQLIIKGRENSFLGYITVDDVTVTAAPIIYSRKSGIWTDVTGGVNGTGTWSLTGHTGAGCGCYPLNTQVAKIGSGHTVTLTASQTNIGTPPTTNLAPGAVDVYGTLQYNTNAVTLGIQQGLFRVRSGGAVNSSAAGITGERISFNAAIGGAALQVDAGGTVAIENLVLGTAASAFHYLFGGGSLAINDILIEASGAALTNSRSASFTVTNALTFNSDNSQFTNNATVSLGNIVVAGNGDDGNVFTNSSGATLTLGGVNGNDGDLGVFNSGTINQSGNFSNISTGSNFDNLATGTWNWTLAPNTTFDTDMNTVLNCAAVGNTFNYSGTGDQSIIRATYHHLRLLNSGIKLTSGLLDVNGDLSIMNTTVLSSAGHAIDVEGDISIQATAALGNATSTGNINIGGNWTAVNAASFVEGSRTVNFDGAAAQIINNASGTETFGSLTLSGGGVKSTSNLIDINGNLSIAGTNPQFSVSNNISLTGNWTVTSTNSDPFIEGTHTVTFDGTGAQAISTVRAAGETFNHLYLTGSSTVSNSSVLDINGNLLIGSSARLDANADISLAGNWSVTSSNGDAFDQGTGALLVTFDGSSDQTIAHTGGETFNRVTVAKPGGNVILNNAITISAGTGTDLNLMQGKIISTATNLITVSDEATSTIGDTDSYIDGPIRKLGEDDFVFPTGSGNYWARIGIEPTSANSTSSFTAQYFASAPPNAASVSGIARVSTIEYWQLAQSGTLANNSQVTLYWESGTRSKITDITPASNLFVARFNGSNWVSAAGTLAGSVATGSVRSGNIAAAGFGTNYTLGTNMALPDNPLPIELLSFSAQLKNKEVELKWSTASEMNNDYFTIERATDLEHFEPIITEDGRGTSKELNNYKVVDASPLYGRSYYRLKQIDFDGKFSYSELRTIDYQGPAFATLTAFPNPLEGSELNIRLEGVRSVGDVRVEILDIAGQIVFDVTLSIRAPGTTTENISNLFLPPGLYIIKAGDTKFLTQKIVVK